MPSAFPPGEPAPQDGSLPEAALDNVGTRPFSVYLHVPFCRVRCGYCDFNTYTLPELGESGAGGQELSDEARSLTETFVEAAHREIALAGEVLGGRPGPVETVFVGGGTPTMLDPDQLGGLLQRVRHTWGLASDAEVTTEANPDTITPEVAQQLAAHGFTRVSIGMQSAVPHVLRTLDRTHDPANVVRAVRAVREAGMQVSLDLIYGTPGESLGDWRTSLELVTSLEPDHVSAYALVVEEGTKLHGQVRRGVVPAPDDDDEADKYELADELLAAAHAACFSMALSLQLDNAGAQPERVRTEAACTVEKVGEGFSITTMKLTTRVKASGIEDARFQELANAAKEGCPVSKALAGVRIELEAKLEN